MESRSYTARDLCAELERAFSRCVATSAGRACIRTAIRNVTHSVLDRTGQ